MTLEEAKGFLRVTVDADDGLISELIVASRELFEAETGRQVVTAKWRELRTGFPARGRPIELSRPPLISVQGVEYLDAAGALQTLAADAYRVVTFSGPLAAAGRIVPAPGSTWPDALRGDPDAVRIAFTAGYGAASASPAAVKLAIRQLVGVAYELRGPSKSGMRESPIAARLLDDFRVSIA